MCIRDRPWPGYDPAALVQAEVEIVVQINGKVKSRMTVPADMDKNQMERFVLEQDKIMELISGKQVVKVIAVPKKLVNIVVK
jgi:leucyl-tRNA synthetase